MAAQAGVSMFLTTSAGVFNLGAAISTSTAFIQTKAIDFGEDGFVKFLERLILNIRGRQQLTSAFVDILGSDDEEGPFEVLDSVNIGENDPVYTDPPGMRYYIIRLRDEAVSLRWTLHAWSIYGEPGGEEF